MVARMETASSTVQPTFWKAFRTSLASNTEKRGPVPVSGLRLG